MDDANPGACAPHNEKLKILFQSFRKKLKKVTRVYIMLTLTCANFWHKKDHV
jgi:hypothetical protein